MDKSRDGERAEKARGAGLPQGLDPATAALYAPWLQQEQNLLSNMFGAGGLGAYSAAAAAAAAMQGLGGMHGMPQGFPSMPQVSSSAGLASIAAAQQAQQQAQVAALASLNPSAAWWNIAGLQQMELLSRLQGGMGGLSAYPGLHPEHLMNLEILQAQHAAAMAAALSATTKTTSAVSRTSSNSSSNSTASGNSHKASSRGASSSTTTSRHHPSSSLLSNSHGRVRDLPSSRSSGGGSHSSRLDLGDAIGSSASSSRLSSSHSSSRLSSSHHSPISVRSDLGAAASAGLSYGIASLMADKHPSQRASSIGSRPPSASTPSELIADRLSSNGSMSLSKVIRNKELEIIPISSSLERLKDSPSAGSSVGGGGLSVAKERSCSNGSANSLEGSSLAAHLSARGILQSAMDTPSKGSRGGSDRDGSSSASFLRDKNEPKVSISTIGGLQLTNGAPSSTPGCSSSSLSNWREEAASVSIEPCVGGSSSGATGGDDAPLNLSLKSSSSKNILDKIEKRESKDLSRADLLSKLKPPLNPFDYPSGMGVSLGMGMGMSPPEMAPSLEMLQSLYGHHGEPRDVLASMQEALQRQLLMADSKRKEDKKRRIRNNSSMEDAQERARHLGRGVSKPKKNTVASLLEHCRAAGIKPQIPLPPSTSIASTSVTTSPTSPSLSSGLPADLASVSSTLPRPSSSGSSQSLPPSLIPLFPQNLPPSLTATLGSSGRSSPPLPPVPSVSISAFPSSTSLPPNTTASSTTSISTLLSFTTPSTTTVTSSTSTSPSVSSLLPLSLPPSLSISSCLSIASVSSASTLASAESSPSKPSITVQPASSGSSLYPKDSAIENRVEITPISSHSEERRSESPSKKHTLSLASMSVSQLTAIAKSGGAAGLPASTSAAAAAVIAAAAAAAAAAARGSVAGALSGICRDIAEMSDSESEDDSSSVSSMDDESIAGYPSPWLKREAPDSHSTHSGSPPPKKRKMITDETSLRIPLVHGWKRETTMRGITQSGVRGEVVYYAPCGKAFKQYPDIIRYLERQNICLVSRDNFSFSSKIAIGEYVDATTQKHYSEQEIKDIVAEIRAKRGLRVLHHGRNSKHEVMKEQEKLRKQEELRKEKEDQRKQREEVNRQRLYEQLRKAQEREQEKQKQKILKDQERERRRYHGILVRSLEARKRHEEREKRREVLREEKRACKEKKREERLAARELTILLKEVKEDMELTDHRQLPDIPHLKGLRLPPEAFGNVLMIFEFLHNFGETLGFDMDSLPALQSLQLAFLGDHECEEELLSILSHLLVCAIEDPGIPNSQRNMTILGQTLNRADITHTNISEILRVYLYANATGEVRQIHGLHGTEKERRETPSKAQEWGDKLSETDAFRMSLWLQRVPLMALNPTQKSEIVGYVCNELLQNKTVLKQIEDSLDRHNGLKTEKWKLDARIRSLCRRLRMSMARKKIYNTAMRNMSEHKEDSNLSTNSSNWERKDEKIKDEDEEDEEEENENESGNDSDDDVEVPDEEEDKNLNMDEATKTLELLQKQMDQVRQELFETSQQVRGYNCGQDRFQRTMWVLPHAGGPFLEGISSCDYIGRCHFPMDIPTSEPKKGISYDEMTEMKEKRKEEREKELKNAREEETVSDEGHIKEVKIKIEDKEEKKVNECLVNGQLELKQDPDHDVKKVNGPSLLKCEKQEVTDPEGSELTHNIKGEKDNKAEVKAQLVQMESNHSACVVNGIREGRESSSSSTPLPVDTVDKDLVATGLGLIPGQYLRPEHVVQCEKLSFTLLPRVPCNASSLSFLPLQTSDVASTPKAASQDADSPLPQSLGSPFSSQGGNNCSTPSSFPLHNSIVAQNLSHKELLEKLHQTAEAVPIPDEYKTGWWHFETSDLLKEFVGTLNDRGARERELRRFLERNFNIVKTSLAKIDADTLSLDAICEEDNLVFNEFGIPVADDTQHWSVETSFRIDLLALEAVYALEEKVTNASMQNKNWKLSETEKPQPDWKPSCLNPLGEEIDIPQKNNPIHVGRERLLALEEGIERRYLKPPLGLVPTPKTGEGTEVKQCDPPKGLYTWKDAVCGCETASQLAMCTYMLETAVAWDKSIMKAYCQFCHSGDFEEKLLLCDGCDKGYHTHCFKPPMDTIPDGDWYCYECVNKFSDSSQRHCLVCGGVEGRTLLHCSNCPRAYHTTCINPPLNKVPRNKWNCPACSSRSPRGRRGRNKKISEGSLTLGATATTTAPNSTTNSPSQTTPSTPDQQNLNTSVVTTTTPATTTATTISTLPSPTPPTTAATATAPPPLTVDLSTPHTAPSVPPPSAPPTPPAPQVPSSTLPSVTSPAGEASPNYSFEEDGSSAVTIIGSGATPTVVATTNGPSAPSTPNSTPKKERAIKKKDLKELAISKGILSELEIHEDSWPFLLPVNTRQFPTYKKIIRKPVDLSTIRKKLEECLYKAKEDFCDDLRLMFNNCETFNEDDSPVGKAGHNLRSFFEAKWNENFCIT